MLPFDITFGRLIGRIPPPKQGHFAVPAAIAEMYHEIQTGAIESWLLRKCRFEDQEAFSEAWSRFILAIQNHELPAEWVQITVGGFVLEYTSSCRVRGLAAGARALKNSELARWMEQKLQQYAKSR